VKTEGYAKSVLIAGGIAGVLSATPLLNLLNIICCLWILLGGAMAVYLVRSDTERKINYGDGAYIGLLTGFFAAFVSSSLFTIFLLLGLNVAKYIPERIPELEQFGDIFTATKVGLNAMLLWFIFSVIIGGVFGALGGIIGTALFAKKKEVEE
jgi:hypothetical protein